MSDALIDKLKNGTCPFTGQHYDCARCELKPEYHQIPGDTPGTHELHMCFCITRFAKGQTTKKEMKQIAQGFIMDGGGHPLPETLLDYFSELYRYGVEVIPMCDCERFCFKHGCMGGHR